MSNRSQSRIVNFDDLPAFSYRDQAKDRVDYVVSTYRRQLSRGSVEWNRLRRIHPNLPFAVQGAVEVATEIWGSIIHLCGDKGEPRIQFFVAVPPLARTLAELIFWAIYLFDDPRVRAQAFHHSIWAKMYSHHIDLTQRYRSDPEWRTWLRDHERECDAWGELVGATPADRGLAQSIARREWPLPSGMRDDLRCSRRKQFLKFLDTWYYGQLSQDVHFTGTGFVMQAGTLIDFDETQAKKIRSDAVFTAMILYLGLLSELALDVTRRGHPIEMLREVWSALGNVFGFAKEFYEERYLDLFAEAEA